MKKIIRVVDEKNGIHQVTIADERWYMKPIENLKTGIPEYKAVPSLTWIAQSYPKGVQYYKWLAEKGWDEAEAIKIAAGDKGSKVHEAIADILQGKEVRIDSKYLNRTNEQLEELTLEECDAILSFKKWYDEVKPTVIAWECSVYSEIHNFAGTIDLICKIDNDYWVIDFKTSQQIWPSHEIQINGYKAIMAGCEHDIDILANLKDYKMAILQVGYRRNKDGYKFTEIEDQYEELLACQTIWKREHESEAPTKKDYPIVLSEALTVAEAMKTNEN